MLLLAGGLSVALGIWADLGALLIAVFCLPTAVLMHGFWKETDPGTRQTEQVMFLKDVALGGAALALLAFFSYAGHDLDHHRAALRHLLTALRLKRSSGPARVPLPQPSGSTAPGVRRAAAG
ncbi:hypothetical protein ACFU5O_07200 [Streptomyces sp. NPDC057445]|uniref:hypothetical protein n=1 Tax=Streptomyces sp. NPDC057445 TaxID=3346136 RepID=UPI003676533C